MALWSNIDELMDYYIPPMPSAYWIDITRTCNLKCIMCPQSKGLGPRQAKMPLEMFRSIVDDICENHPVIKLYLSGEPLLHDMLFDMIEYAGEKGCQTMIHTNGTLLTKELSERILSSSLTFISFSFDGCSPEIYEKLRPPAKFEAVRSNIRQYLDLRHNRGDGGPHTTIEIIRMQETESLLQDFVDEWKTSGVDKVNVADYMTWLGSVDDRRIAPSSGGARYKPCEAPFRHGCILSDGTVVPCCMDVNGRMPLGNITERGFREIWISHEYRQLRLRMLTADSLEGSICDGCYNTFYESK